MATTLHCIQQNQALDTA